MNLYKISKIGLANVLVFGLLFVVFEGAASLYFAYQGAQKEIEKEPFLAERLHTEYDPLLGWINKSNVSIDHMYGPNIFFKTNSQRFRNQDDFSPKVSKGRIRVICSGDSFALGYGVDNDHTWCRLLETLNPKYQTVNMGQGGYGIGQAYLWYKRDGARLDHNIHIFSFVSSDFQRMTGEYFLGVPKPLLRLRNGKISVENNPVTRLSFHKALKYLRQVNILRLADEIGAISLPASKGLSKVDEDEATKLITAVFNSLNKINKAKNSTLLLVHLPMEVEYRDKRTDIFRTFLRQESEKMGIKYLDLVKKLRWVPPSEVKGFYFQKDFKGFYGSAGHFTNAGNAFIAKKIYESLEDIDVLNAQ